ncbi:carcinoembryonic antigen-related cell adhesion molecule 8-like [Etheostoma cragini]|uniref:carcinoembryonic antigen-related cell adhesion molecule 8-like n=1 Tax=Etheostoma cragini TaxID=417921 RepID=UPI00155EAC2D|nr:carcinoembryonic antigen-related cell adhesion molecule 8-like [Etheostoma cragini]
MTTLTTTTNTTAVSNFFTMDIPFEDSFNDQNSSIYKDSLKAILLQTAKYTLTVNNIKLKFRSGSTIGDYTITTTITSFNENVVEAVNVGIFTELAKKYLMVYKSPQPLKFQPLQVFLEGKLIITCGPPPENLNLSSGLTAEWRLNGKEIVEDPLHKLQLQNVTATLTVLKVFITDSGSYECTLKYNNTAFRQTGTFPLTPTPVIQTAPTTQKIKCGTTVNLTCSVKPSPPYQVTFPDQKISTGSGPNITYPYSIPCPGQNEIITCKETNTNFTKSTTLILFTGGKY